VTLPNLGVPLTFARQYHSFNTQQSNYDRGLGEGWSFSYSDRIDVSGSDRIWFTDSGLRLTFTWDSQTSSYKTPKSLFGSFTYSSQTHQYNWADKDGSTIVFHDTDAGVLNGKVLSIADRYGNGVGVHYQANGDLDYVCDLLDSTRRLTFIYNTDTIHHIIAVKDFTGRVWSYGYNSDHRLVSVTAPVDPTISVVQMSYDYFTDSALAGLLKSVTDPNGAKTLYDYYVNRRGRKVTDADGASHSISFNLYRDRTLFLDERQALTEYDHGSDGNVVRQTNADQTTVAFTWLGGLRMSSTDAFGQTTNYYYDANGKTLYATDPLDNLTSNQYSTTATTFVNLLQTTARGHATDPTALVLSSGNVSSYDSLPDNSWSVSPDGKSLTLSGNTSIKYNMGSYHVTANTLLSFDFTSSVEGLYHLIGIDNDSTLSSAWQFQLFGSDATADGRHYQFNAYGASASAVKHFVIPVGEFITDGTYSYLTFLTKKETGQGTTPTSVFSNIKVFESGPTATQYTYSDNGTSSNNDGKSLWKVTSDPSGLNTIRLYEYNWSSNRGSVMATTTPDGVATPSIADDYKTKYTYNAAGQVLTTRSHLASNQWQTERFAYNADGTLQSDTAGYFTDDTGALVGTDGTATTNSYDLFGRRTKQTLPDPDDGGPLPAPVTVWFYDAAGNVISTSLATASPQETTTSFYDAMNRAVKVLNADSTYRTVQYDGAGNVVSQTDEFGRVTQFVYDLRNRLVATIRPDGETVSSQYNGGGRVVASTDALGNTTRLEYDKLGRKTAEVLPYNGLVSTQDDDAASYSGTWGTYYVGLNGDCRYVVNSPTNTSATWTFNLPQSTTSGKFYEVLVTWTPFSNNSHAAPYTVYDGDTGSARHWAATVDQTLAPPAQGYFIDGGWYSLGRFWITGTTPVLTLKLSGVANDQVIADAVRIVEVDQNGFGYDSQGNLQYASVGGPLGDISYTTEFRHDKLGRTKAVLSPDADGNASTKDRPIALTTYDADGNAVSVVDSRGASDDTLDAYGNVTNDPSSDGSDAKHTTQYTLDELGRKIIQTLPDPDGSGSLTNLYTWLYYDAHGNLQYAVNANWATSSRPATFNASASYTTEEVYDGLNRKTQEKMPDPDGSGSRPITSFAFDATGNLASTTNPLGAVTRYGYDLRNRQTKITDDLGDTTTTTFDAVGNAILVTDALGRKSEFEYDSLNRRILQTLPLPDGNTQDLSQTAWFYDANGNLAMTIDPRGYATWTIFDAWNRPVEATDALGGYAGDPKHTVTTSYDQLNRITAVTDQLGRTTTYVYDNLGRKIETIAPDPDDYRAMGGSNGALSSSHTYFGYDTNGNLKYATDALNMTGRGDTAHTTWYFYDTLNRQVCTLDQLSTEDTWTLTTIPDSINLAVDHRHSTITTFDTLGDVTAVKQAVDASNYHTTTYEFDNLGRMTAEVAPDPGDHTYPTTHFVHDLAGNLIETIDPLGQTTYNKYDVLNRLVRTVDPRGTGPDDTHFATVTVFDAVGKVTSTTDSDGNTTSESFDRLDRLVKETDPFWNDSHFWFDPAGNMTTKLDRDSRITEYGYDALDRQVEEAWGIPATHTIVSQYDADGELTGIVETDATSDTAETNYLYAYDQAGQMIRNRMATGDLPQDSATNASSSFTNATDWDGDGYSEPYYTAVNFNSYFRLGDVLELTVASSTCAPALIIQRPSGSSVSRFYESATVPGTLVVDVPIDALGTWVIYVTTPDNLTTQSPAPTLTFLVNPTVSEAVTELNYVYYTDGSLAAIQDDWNNGGTYYQYDSDGRMTLEAQGTWSGSTLTANKQVAYAYNDDGSTKTLTRYQGDGTTEVATSTYGYDGMGRLTDLDHKHSTTTITGYDYILDAASRITKMTSSRDGDNNYTLDATDQLLSASLTSENFSYDQTGNRTNSGYVTGAANQLLSDGIYTYEIDQEGNRIKRTKISDGSVTVYGYDQRNRLIRTSQEIGAATLGQWAASVIAVSSQRDTSGHAASQTLGAADVASYGDNSGAWSPSSQNGTIESLTLGFGLPVFADNVVIRETDGNGFVTQVEVRNWSTGKWETVWANSGGDGALPGSPQNVVFSFTRRNYLVDAVHITVNTDHNQSTYEEIDSVQLWGSPGKATTYTYDTYNRRIARTVDANADAWADEYRYQVFQGSNPYMEVLDNYDGLSNGFTNATIATRSFYGPAADQIIAIDASGVTRWGLADHEGTIRDVIDNSAALLGHRKYDAFGTVTEFDANGNNITTTGTLIGSFTPSYTGKSRDVVAGLFYYNGRWYDSLTGRFTTEDPSGLSAGVNLYAYCGNSPVDRNDPTGMFGLLVSSGSSSYFPTSPNNLTIQSTGYQFSYEQQIGLGLLASQPFASPAGPALPANGMSQPTSVVKPQYQNFSSQAAFFDAKMAYVASFPTKEQRIAADDDPAFWGANAHFAQIEDQQLFAQIDAKQAADQKAQSAHYQQLQADYEAQVAAAQPAPSQPWQWQGQAAKSSALPEGSKLLYLEAKEETLGYDTNFGVLKTERKGTNSIGAGSTSVGAIQVYAGAGYNGVDARASVFRADAGGYLGNQNRNLGGQVRVEGFAANARAGIQEASLEARASASFVETDPRVYVTLWGVRLGLEGRARVGVAAGASIGSRTGLDFGPLGLYLIVARGD